MSGDASLPAPVATDKVMVLHSARPVAKVLGLKRILETTWVQEMPKGVELEGGTMLLGLEIDEGSLVQYGFSDYGEGEAQGDGGCGEGIGKGCQDEPVMNRGFGAARGAGDGSGKDWTC